MGATQSKKRRKDKDKSERDSVPLGMPRSASMDNLRSPEVTSGSPTCPLCPHCRSSVSWSSDHSLTHSLCLYHARQGRGDVWDSDVHQRSREVGGDSSGFKLCPNCQQSASSQGCLHLCEISNQDYDKMSTVSLTRDTSDRHWAKPNRIVQSKSEEFANPGSSKDQRFRAKENVNPNSCHSDSKSTFSKRKTNDKCRTAIANSLSASSDQSMEPTVPLASSMLSSSPPPSLSSQDTGRDGSSSKEIKSNISLLDDDEAVLSRWVKRKQMAQELRNLRLHLQLQDVIEKETSVVDNNHHLSSASISNNNNNNEEDNTIGAHNHTTQVLSNPASNNLNSASKEHQHYLYHINTSKESVSTTTVTTTSSTSSPSRKSVRSKFSRLGNYRFLDNHPVMTRLQNEQNNRLEMMERRMEEIRTSAMQEAERRKFAEIFPAKNDDTETQKLLREARESLERIKEEKRLKCLSHKGQQEQQCHQNLSQLQEASLDGNLRLRSTDSRLEDDSGEIIPVRVLSNSREGTPANSKVQQRVTVSDKGDQYNKAGWWSGDWPDINLGKPLTWLWLPFMLFPLVLRMLLSIVINSVSSPVQSRNGNSSISSGHNPDRSRSVSRHRRKKSG